MHLRLLTALRLQPTADQLPYLVDGAGGMFVTPQVDETQIRRHAEQKARFNPSLDEMSCYTNPLSRLRESKGEGKPLIKAFFSAPPSPPAPLPQVGEGSVWRASL